MRFLPFSSLLLGCLSYEPSYSGWLVCFTNFSGGISSLLIVMHQVFEHRLMSLDALFALVTAENILNTGFMQTSLIPHTLFMQTSLIPQMFSLDKTGDILRRIASF